LGGKRVSPHGSPQTIDSQNTSSAAVTFGGTGGAFRGVNTFAAGLRILPPNLLRREPFWWGYSIFAQPYYSFYLSVALKVCNNSKVPLRNLFFYPPIVVSRRPPCPPIVHLLRHKSCTARNRCRFAGHNRSTFLLHQLAPRFLFLQFF